MRGAGPPVSDLKGLGDGSTLTRMIQIRQQDLYPVRRLQNHIIKSARAAFQRKAVAVRRRPVALYGAEEVFDAANLE